tara:strand:+ start:1436 stop:2059 length:624 start_codon:yes stop_codon:yes gene_type:complete
MGIRNNNIELEYQCLFIPATAFTGVGFISGSEELKAAGNGNAPLKEAGTTGLLGLEFSSGDRVQTLLSQPTSIDVDSDIFVRCFWYSTADTDENNTFTPVVSYSQIGDFFTIPTDAASKTALNIAIPADTANSGSTFYATSAGTINAGSISVADEQHDALVLQVEATLAGTLADFRFLGLELWFMPKLTRGAQKSKVALPHKVKVAQ